MIYSYETDPKLTFTISMVSKKQKVILKKIENQNKIIIEQSLIESIKFINNLQFHLLNSKEIINLIIKIFLFLKKRKTINV